MNTCSFLNTGSFFSEHHIFRFQLFEWVQWLRVTGKVPLTLGSSPVFSDLVREVNSIEEPKKEQKQDNTVRLSRSEMETVANLGYASDWSQVEPCSVAEDKVTCQRNLTSVTWHTVKKDNGKKTATHYVCWVKHNTPFQKYASLDDIEDFHFGEIHYILKVTVGEKITYFLRVKEMKTIHYNFGGIWKCSLTDPRKAFLPLDWVSEPLITVKSNDLIHILNSKIRFSPSEARTILDHISKQD